MTSLNDAVELDVLQVIHPEENKQLHFKSAPIAEIDDDVRLLAWSMAKTMYEEPGVGLAAPQVGVAVRLVVLDPNWTSDPKNVAQKPIFMVNPKITWWATDDDDVPVMQTAEESCLSVPGLAVPVERYEEIEVTFTNLDGEEEELWCDPWTARIVQHEIDHLDGVLLIDHLSRLKADMYWKKVKKAKRLARRHNRRMNSNARNLRASERRLERARSRKLQPVSEESTTKVGSHSQLNWRKSGDPDSRLGSEKCGLDS